MQITKEELINLLDSLNICVAEGINKDNHTNTFLE